MRCYFTCRAEGYALQQLSEHFSRARLERQVVHLESQEGHAFFFSYGCAVFWGLSEEAIATLVKECSPFEIKPLKAPCNDEMLYCKSERNALIAGEIQLKETDSQSFFALSHAMAQSVKLDSFEERIQSTINELKPISQEMATKGKVSLSGREIRKKIGSLFIERSSINLHFDLLDKPEVLWEYPEVEPLYGRAANYLDISNRVEVLNQKLCVIHDFFEMLTGELNQKQSSRLEIIIIVLILIEVFLLLMKDVLGWL